MMKRFVRCRFLPDAARNCRGSAMIEFGFALPLLAFLSMIVVDSSRGFAAKLKLEDAAARTLEKVTAKGETGSDYEPMRQEAATAAGRPLTDVILDKWVECDRVRQTDFDTVCPTGQEYGRYLSIRINGFYTPMFNAGSLASIYGGQGMGDGVQIRGDAAVRLQ